jgi:hypothetical protein
MASATEMITALEDQVFETVRQSQEVVVKAVQSWAEAGKSVMPEVPALPFADQLPNAVDMVENAFNFADRLLATQRQFAAAVLDAAKPMLGAADKAVKSNGSSRSASGSKTTP